MRNGIFPNFVILANCCKLNVSYEILQFVLNYIIKLFACRAFLTATFIKYRRLINEVTIFVETV